MNINDYYSEAGQNHINSFKKETQVERIEPRYQTTAPVKHWSKKLKEENARMKAAIDYLQFQLRLIPQSRFDKYANCGDSESVIAYRKCAGEVALRADGANCVSQEILDGESKWCVETKKFID